MHFVVESVEHASEAKAHGLVVLGGTGLHVRAVGTHSLEGVVHHDLGVLRRIARISETVDVLVVHDGVVATRDRHGLVGADLDLKRRVLNPLRRTAVDPLLERLELRTQCLERLPDCLHGLPLFSAHAVEDPLDLGVREAKARADTLAVAIVAPVKRQSQPVVSRDLARHVRELSRPLVSERDVRMRHDLVHVVLGENPREDLRHGLRELSAQLRLAVSASVGATGEQIPPEAPALGAIENAAPGADLHVIAQEPEESGARRRLLLVPVVVRLTATVGRVGLEDLAGLRDGVTRAHLLAVDREVLHLTAHVRELVERKHDLAELLDRERLVGQLNAARHELVELEEVAVLLLSLDEICQGLRLLVDLEARRELEARSEVLELFHEGAVDGLALEYALDSCERLGDFGTGLFALLGEVMLQDLPALCVQGGREVALAKGGSRLTASGGLCALVDKRLQVANLSSADGLLGKACGHFPRHLLERARDLREPHQGAVLGGQRLAVRVRVQRDALAREGVDAVLVREVSVLLEELLLGLLLDDLIAVRQAGEVREKHHSVRGAQHVGEDPRRDDRRLAAVAHRVALLLEHLHSLGRQVQAGKVWRPELESDGLAVSGLHAGREDPLGLSFRLSVDLGRDLVLDVLPVLLDPALDALLLVSEDLVVTLAVGTHGRLDGLRGLGVEAVQRLPFLLRETARLRVREERLHLRLFAQRRRLCLAAEHPRVQVAHFVAHLDVEF